LVAEARPVSKLSSCHFVYQSLYRSTLASLTVCDYIQLLELEIRAMLCKIVQSAVEYCQTTALSIYSNNWKQ